MYRERLIASPTSRRHKGRTGSGTAPARLRSDESSNVEPLVEVTQNTSSHTPDVVLAERHRVKLADDASKFAAAALMVARVHQKRERHFERFNDLGGIECKLEMRCNSRDHRQDAKA